jgi:RNA-binding protein
MLLKPHQIRTFRGLAHHLKPVVMVGEKGITENLLAELNRALDDHELIKVSIAGADRADRRLMTAELCQTTGAQLVQLIGRVSVLYRPRQEVKGRSRHSRN